MWDDDNLKQQQAIGILGTNLIYGAFYLKELPDQLIESLLDNLDPNRIEVDLIKFSGPDFEKINNRIMNLLLVRKGAYANGSIFTRRQGRTSLQRFVQKSRSG